jgi:hypothetical protein
MNHESHLRVVRPRRSKFDIYTDAYQKLLDGGFDLNKRMQLAFYGVRWTNMVDYAQLDDNQISSMFRQMDFILHVIGALTPRQLANVFPVHKSYDGKKHGMKDYFTTMSACEKIGLDVPIGFEKAVSFLTDYENHHLKEFVVHQMSVSNDILRKITHSNQPDPFEAIFMMAGAKTKTVSTDSQGRKFLYDPDENKFHRLGKKKMAYGNTRI